MQRPHSPPYIAEIRKTWRVIVPIRGKLAPRICPQAFQTQLTALAWLQSEHGKAAVQFEQSRNSKPVPRSRSGRALMQAGL